MQTTLIDLICFTSVAPGYALLFPQSGITDYVIMRDMPSLTALTACLWMKTNDTGNQGTPLSYELPGSYNELNIYDYNDFVFSVGNTYRY